MFVCTVVFRDHDLMSRRVEALHSQGGCLRASCRSSSHILSDYGIATRHTVTLTRIRRTSQQHGKHVVKVQPWTDLKGAGAVAREKIKVC